MAGERHGTADWPGTLGSVESCSYTCSHGITPGVALLSCHPPDGTLPAMLGDLLITDGVGTVFLPGCKVVDYAVDQDGGGTVMHLSILDRRWRWASLGVIDGCYNQLDPHGKLIPWTIRSPRELALLCLAAMGEPIFDVSALPPGINYPGPRVTAPIVNISGVNPPINWYAVPPAQALQQVAESCGCRVVYDPVTNGVLLARLGQGGDLPPGSLSKQSPSLKPPDAPSAVAVIGAPTVYQVQLTLQPVGEEWDGHYVPIDLLSYAPPATLAKAGVTCQWAVTLFYDVVDVGAGYRVLAGSTGDDAAHAGVPFNVGAYSGGTADNYAEAMADLINASVHPKIKGLLTASADGPTVTITGVKDGYSFKVAAKMVAGAFHEENDIKARLVREAVPPVAFQKRWAKSHPGFNDDVVATNRLNYTQARALAQKTVFSCYQVVDVSFAPGKLPGYPGPIVRRQQFVLTDEQVDQVVPDPGDATIRNRQHDRYIADFYNGYSKSKKAAVYGSVAQSSFTPAGLVFKQGATPTTFANTPAGSVVPVSFTIDKFYQVVQFSSPVWIWPSTGKGLDYPKLVLQTGALIRDANSNQTQAFSRTLPLPGGNPAAPLKAEVHQDVQANVSVTWNAAGRVTRVNLLEADPVVRAQYYLEGMAAQYDLKRGQTNGYNGIVPVRMDGAISQATWSVGPSGASTTASRCFEHAPFVPSYPARRRAEFLPPPAGGAQKVPMANAGSQNPLP